METLIPIFAFLFGSHPDGQKSEILVVNPTTSFLKFALRYGQKDHPSQSLSPFSIETSASLEADSKKPREIIVVFLGRGVFLPK